ncbi:MAG: hypothetical protein KIT62_07745 [Cyclobacteriaceae bacterium]|nr:hypothetical protein [Cyclobacteriaceae bacterium]
MKYIIKVMSDYTALFWDSEGVCIGSAGDDLEIDGLEGFKMSDELKKDFQIKCPAPSTGKSITNAGWYWQTNYKTKLDIVLRLFTKNLE